tara:strand:+ start:11384 stop:11554 length:171 start_codon:yes stop_codon:yes gene_type:complete
MHPGSHIVQKQRKRPVIICGIILSTKPAIGSKMTADFILKFDFFAKAHVLPNPIDW